MIKEFVERFDAARPTLLAKFKQSRPADYAEIVRTVIETVRSGNVYKSPDPNRIHEINDGDYQGTLVFVIGAGGYQPSRYWYVKVDYGSCSGCDTLEAIHGYSNQPVTDREASDYVTLALHIVQGLKEMGDEEFVCEQV